MAWVFRVEDPKFRVHRALKMLKPQARGVRSSPFRSEAKLLARIDHPNLITIYDSARRAHPLSLLHDDVRGRLPLSESEPLAREVAVPIFLDVLSALERLHLQGIITATSSRENIRVMSDGRVLLGDSASRASKTR